MVLRKIFFGLQITKSSQPQCGDQQPKGEQRQQRRPRDLLRQPAPRQTWNAGKQKSKQNTKKVNKTQKK
jgi:hypothetical protein